MVRILGRVFVCALMMLQAVQPALACECVHSDDCGCATQCTTCEPRAESETCDECASQATIVDDCGCGTVESAEDSTDEPSESETLPSVTPAEPQPAETQKPETFAPTTEQAPTETPAPALEPTSDTLPPAPIAVPSDPAPTDSNQERILPGPAPAETAPAETTPAEEASPGRTNTEGLFDEPARATEPSDATSTPATEESTTDEAASESTETDGLFDEPTPPAEESSEDSDDTAPADQPETETPEGAEEESEPAADPLDELFGPSTPAEDPAPESPPESSDDTEEEESNDPFGETSAVLNAAGGLASSDYRTWSDRSTQVSFAARLIRFSPSGVFLSQPSGEIVAVSFAQLSDSDLRFVRGQVRSQRELLARAAGVQVATTHP